jgi:flagellar L-ring protein precursor FlgH
MPDPQPASYNSNSLWRNGSRAFFKDQRASRVGDILTVIVEITDKAEIDNQTARTRENSEDLGLDSIAGYEAVLKKLLPKSTRDTVNFADLIKLDSAAKSKGAGSVNREEKLTTKMAALVTQRLPNGNLVIEGRQEIRVNFEIREVVVAGIVRPEDISAENTIPISKIAEARVAYGGRGQLTDVQQPRYGQQVLDVVLPF